MDVIKKGNLYILPDHNQYRKHHEILIDIRKYLMDGDDLWMSYDLAHALGDYMGLFSSNDSDHHFMVMNKINELIFFLELFIDDVGEDV